MIQGTKVEYRSEWVKGEFEIPLRADYSLKLLDGPFKQWSLAGRIEFPPIDPDKYENAVRRLALTRD